MVACCPVPVVSAPVSRYVVDVAAVDVVVAVALILSI